MSDERFIAAGHISTWIQHFGRLFPSSSVLPLRSTTSTLRLLIWDLHGHPARGWRLSVPQGLLSNLVACCPPLGHNYNRLKSAHNRYANDMVLNYSYDEAFNLNVWEDADSSFLNCDSIKKMSRPSYNAGLIDQFHIFAQKNIPFPSTLTLVGMTSSMQRAFTTMLVKRYEITTMGILLRRLMLEVGT